MQLSSYISTWEVCYALKKIKLHSAIASCDAYASFVLSNLLHAYIARKLHTARSPFLNYKSEKLKRVLSIFKLNFQKMKKSLTKWASDQ